MKANLGQIDRMMRIILGVVLIALSLFGIIGWWGWLGVIPLGTGLMKFCPLYRLFGINTCKTCDKEAQ